MTPRNAVYYLELATLLHRDIPTVRKVAKRMVKRVPPHMRPSLRLICQSKNPIAVIQLMVAELSRQPSQPSPCPYPGFSRPPLKWPQPRA